MESSAICAISVMGKDVLYTNIKKDSKESFLMSTLDDQWVRKPAEIYW